MTAELQEFVEKLDSSIIEHQGLTQRAHVEETFHQFAQGEPSSGDSTQDWINDNTVGKDTAYAATKSILEMWDISMNEDQEKLFKETHFEPTWNKYMSMGMTATDHLSNQYASAFIKDLASTYKTEQKR